MKEGIIFIEKAFWNKISSTRERYAILDKLIRSQSAIYTTLSRGNQTLSRQNQTLSR